jgi:hypothetical protein
LLILIIIVGAPAALYLWRETDHRDPQSAQGAGSESPPAIRYPIEMVGPPPESLPSPGDSNEIVRSALVALFGGRLDKLLVPQEIVRRFVVTVDNLPRDHIAVRLLPLTPVRGVPVTTQTDQGLALGRKNAARYWPYLRLAQAVPTDKLVAVYVRFYPLLQQQYEGLGYPNGYFNDRVVHVIDHLLATPDADRPLLVVQPRVLYEFADPALERLSAGQKILLRMGPENTRKLKSKLREIRQALVANAPSGSAPALD